MKLIPSEKDTLDRLQNIFREETVHAPHTAQNHSAHYLIDVQSTRGAHTVAELINHEIEIKGEAPIAFPAHVVEGRIYDGSATKEWLAVDVPSGLEETVLETIENAPRRIRALLDSGKQRQVSAGRS